MAGRNVYYEYYKIAVLSGTKFSLQLVRFSIEKVMKLYMLCFYRKEIGMQKSEFVSKTILSFVLDASSKVKLI